ncbi:hypothetical protein DOE73_07180 [Paenibacillus dendritiformis]|nr:hypothetical protein DOE73_07180 [Paenibacillus dendritiformis]
MPDFIPLHFYPHDHIEEVLHAELAAPLGLPLHRYRRILEGSWGSLRIRVFAGHACAGDEAAGQQRLSDKAILTEWNRPPIRELTNDTV